MGDEAIVVKDLKKYFRIPLKKKGSSSARFLRLPIGGSGFYTKKVLDEISFEIHKGECFGIIGPNGAGKSTLLKLLCGVLNRDSGSIEVEGTMVPLISLGVGFSMDLTAKDNVLQYGMLLGISREEMERKYPEIIRFADLEKYEDLQLKHFSSGMRIRLGFSIAVQVNPDIILLDEVLGVGDESFRKKSNEKIIQMRYSGKTIILVSHNMDSITHLCDRAMLLVDGKIRDIGHPKQVVNSYFESLREKLQKTDIFVPGKRVISERWRQSNIEGLTRMTGILDSIGFWDTISGYYSPEESQSIMIATVLEELASTGMINELTEWLILRPGQEGGALDEQYRAIESFLVDLGSIPACRLSAHVLLRGICRDGVLFHGNDRLAKLFSDDRPEDLVANTGEMPADPVHTLLLIDGNRIIPVLADREDRTGGIAASAVTYILEQVEIGRKGALVILPSIRNADQILSALEGRDTGFIVRVKQDFVEKDERFTPLLDDLESNRYLLVDDLTVLFGKSFRFEPETHNVPGVIILDPAERGKEITRFVSTLHEQIEMTKSLHLSPDRTSEFYLRKLMGLNVRYIERRMGEHDLEVFPDEAAVNRHLRVMGVSLFLSSRETDPVDCHRIDELRVLTHRCFSSYIRMLGEPDALQRGLLLLHIVKMVLKIGTLQDAVRDSFPGDREPVPES